MLRTLLLTTSSLALVGCATGSVDAPNAPIAAGSNRAFAHTLNTDAPASAIWAVWTDVTAWPDWDTELVSATLDGPFREGAQGRLTPVSGPSSRFVIEDVEPGQAYTLATRLPLGRLRVRRTLSEVDSVAFTHAVTFEGFGGWLLRGRLGPRFRRALPLAMARLRHIAEQGVEAGSEIDSGEEHRPGNREADS
ncbi:MAG: SRPBCC family protein [Bacteroidota bacterium]